MWVSAMPSLYILTNSGTVTISILSAPCSVAALCQSLLRKTEPLAAQKKQHLNFPFISLETVLRTDEEQLYKLLMHLLDNAVKFTPAGGELGLELVWDEAMEQVKFMVWDTGIGIHAEDFPRLFQPFVQLDASLARQYEGSGLGLALAHQLAGLLGGCLDVTSVWGEGSRFTLTLPLSQRQPV